MSVGVILDETPEKCKDCPLVQVNPEEDGGFRYCFNGEWCKLYDHKPRPDWCPLQEVEPVRRGHWEETTVKEIPYLACSECGHAELYSFAKYPYCPNCGAKLEGVAK